MVKEMIAGDELEPENEDMVRATGYLARKLVHVQTVMCGFRTRSSTQLRHSSASH